LYRGGLPAIQVKNLSIDLRDAAFDPLKEPGLDLSAADAEDGNLTTSIKAQVKTVATWGSAASKATVAYNAIPAVDTKTPKLYIIAYSVTDSDGNTAALNAYVTVRNDGSTSVPSGPASILPPAPNTVTGSVTSSNAEKVINNTPFSREEMSAESAVATPPMGVQGSGATLLLAFMLTSAAAICLIAKHRHKAR